MRANRTSRIDTSLDKLAIEIDLDITESQRVEGYLTFIFAEFEVADLEFIAHIDLHNMKKDMFTIESPKLKIKHEKGIEGFYKQGKQAVYFKDEKLKEIIINRISAFTKNFRMNSDKTISQFRNIFRSNDNPQVKLGNVDTLFQNHIRNAIPD